MKNIKYYLYCKLTFLRDRTPSPLTEILDWIRHEILWDVDDERHNYE